MSQNNQMYKFYSEMTKGHRENQPALFEHGVRSWMAMEPECPFGEGSDEAELFFKMQMGYTIWQRNGADKNINRRRMLEAAHQLCELNPQRPYKFDKAEDAEDRRQAKANEEEAKRLAEEEAELLKIQQDAEEKARLEAEEEEKDMLHVFGVVDHKDKETKELKVSRLKSLFKR